jgi:hypothetical protein
MVEPLRHRQTKGVATDMFYLMPPRHIFHLPKPALGPQQSLVRSSPDSVEKVLFGRRTKFFRTADAFHAQRREGSHRFTQTQPRTLVLVLKSRAAAERPNNRSPRDFQSRSIFGFFNTIPLIADLR